MLFWFMAFIIIIVLVMNLIYEQLALKGVSYTRYFSKRTVFEGEPLEMVEVISNAKWLPLPWLRLETSMPIGVRFERQNNLNISSGAIYQYHVSLFFLRSYRQVTRRHQVACKGRGVYCLNTATLTTGDPLGMVQKVKKFNLDLQLHVYPKILSIQELPLPNHSWLGQLVVRRWIVEDPFLTAGVREYRSGDGYRSINWKATARTGSIQVHQRDYTADHRLMICLNIESSDTMWKSILNQERIENGIRYAASVANYALANGIETGILCNGRLLDGNKESIIIEPSTAADQLELLLIKMTRLVMERVEPMFRLLDRVIEAGTTDMDYLIISCHQGEQLRERARQLERQGNGVEWMNMLQGGHSL